MVLESSILKVKTQPRDAATLILVRFDGPAPRILMGQRHTGHTFMPNKFVFPGGGFDAADSKQPVAVKGERVTIEKLKLRMRPKPSNRRAHGLLVTALRETYEETGFQAGGLPFDLTGLVYFARAITPPGRSRRFDSRFFVADASIVTNLESPHPLPSEELLELNWVTMLEALDLNLPSITRDVLGLLAPFLAEKCLPPKDCPISFHFNRGKTWRVEMLWPHKT
jgi:8-oxo-dGTP pyrophosphatase MutT (NUDIX family)